MADYGDLKLRNIEPRPGSYDYEAGIGAYNIKSTYHPFFGKITVDDKYRPLMTPNNVKKSYRDYVSRELGFSREITTNNRILNGLSKPGDYLLARNEAMNDLINDLGDEYRKRFMSLINLGHKKEDADRKALHYASEIGKLRQKEIDEMFPTTITQEAFGRLNRKNQIGDLAN